MNRVSVIPANEEAWLALRRADITSTECAALFNLSPYMTYYELWHRHHKNLPSDFEANERSTWGNRLQAAISDGIAEDEDWVVKPAPEYIRIPELRIGSSFDNWLGDDAILEIKNVDALIFKDGWLVDENKNIEAPPHIELQVQHQMLVSGKTRNVIGAFIGGNKVVKIERLASGGVHKAIIEKAAAFWDSIDKGIEPKPDFEKDAAFICKLYSSVREGKIMDASNNEVLFTLAQEYKRLSQAGKDADASRQGVKAQILMMIGDCEKVLANGFSVSAGIISPAFIEAHERAGRRDFRINWKKVK